MYGAEEAVLTKCFRQKGSTEKRAAAGQVQDVPAVMHW